MSSDPLAPPQTLDSTADFVVRNRSLIGWLVAAVGLAVLVVGATMLVRAVLPYQSASTTPPTAETPAEGEKKEAAEAPPHPYRMEYTWGGLVAIGAALTIAAAGVWTAVGLPKLTVEDRRSDARHQLLAIGGAFGISLIFGGLTFFILWFRNLQGWLSDGKNSDAVWIIGPLLAVLLGAGLIFLACQPARREERSNPTLRRLVYGTNFALAAFLLFVLLLVGNVLAGMKLPNTLDTTATGFYSFTLDPATIDYLTKIDVPVKIYSTVPTQLASTEGSHLATDTQRMLEAVRLANPTLITIRQLSINGLDRDEIDRLRTKFPRADLNNFGLLVTVGADEARYGFIQFQELMQGEGQKIEFIGESRLMREMLFLTEGGTSPIIYFLQGHGELSFGEGVEPARSARIVRTELETANYQVKTLEPGMGAVDFKIPDDADVLVIADPMRPLEPEVQKAIKAYLDTPRSNGKKGRLAVTTGAHAQPDGRFLITGLEDLLSGYGVRLGTKFLFNQPVRASRHGAPTYALIPGTVPDELATGSNTAAVVFSKSNIVLPRCRIVDAVPAGNLQATRILTTPPRFPTWQEETYPENVSRTWLELREPTRLNSEESDDAAINRFLALRQRREFSDKPVPVGVTVSEGETARLIVLGSGEFLTDTFIQQTYGGQPIPARLFAASIDFLRDRPKVSTVVTKSYGIYTINPEPNAVRLLWLPGGIAVLVILALGAGMWASRRA